MNLISDRFIEKYKNRELDKETEKIVDEFIRLADSDYVGIEEWIKEKRK